MYGVIRKSFQIWLRTSNSELVEFVNSEGYDPNKIEGQWRQMKVRLINISVLSHREK